MAQAKANLKTAQDSLKAGNYDACAFYSQQTAEMALKALIVHKGETPPKTHDLMLLLEVLLPPVKLREALQVLTLFEQASRYPDAAKELYSVKDSLFVAQGGPPVCRFFGSVELDSKKLPSGTTVAAFESEGRKKLAETTSVGSSYVLTIVESGAKSLSRAEIYFEVGGHRAREKGLWLRGNVRKVDLTAYSKMVAPTDVFTREIARWSLEQAKEVLAWCQKEMEKA